MAFAPEAVQMAASLTSDDGSVISITLFVTLLCACIVVGHLLEDVPWMNESTTALAIGLCTGFIIRVTTGGKSSRLFVFSEDLFFIYLLPPIIFNAGFQVKKKQFFQNFITIMSFGVIGTLISFCVISLGAILMLENVDNGSFHISDYLALGAIFSATDSVCTLQVLNQDHTPILYSVVFGEGVVNDATSVVLFNAIERFDLSNINIAVALQFISGFFYLFMTSTLLGVFTGLLSAYTLKKLYIGRHSTDREVSLMILMAYLSYILAELLNLSAILTIFFSGIVMSHYTWHNVTESSRVTTKHTFATLSFISELFIFLYVGMDALDVEKWKYVASSPGKSIRVSSVLLGLVLLGRAAFVFLLSFLSNLTKKFPEEKIDFKKQVTIWWAGLMRGAVSVALAYNKFSSSGNTKLSVNATMITSTITVVLFSTVVFGLMTKPLVRILLFPKSKPMDSFSSDILSSKSFFTPLLRSQASELDLLDITRPTSLRTLFQTPTRTVHYFWRKFDDGFMRPMFGGRGFVPFALGSPTERDANWSSD